MRRLLDSVIKNLKPTTTPIHSSSPSISTDLSYSDFNYITNRGFLALKISQYLNLHKDNGDFLFFQSLQHTSFMNFTNETDKEFILYLSELMLNWSKGNKDISKQIKETQLRIDIQNAMLKAYEIYKNDIFTTTFVKEDVKTTNLPSLDPKWLVYRDVIFAATQGQFLLISHEDVSKYKQGRVFCDGFIKERRDIPLCRNNAKECLEKEGLPQSKYISWLLVLSEAITNTIKHGEEGRMTLINDSERQEVRFVIEDKGPGFSLKDLPKMTLLAGFSTKKSLGQGFTLMMKLTKQVLLNTSVEGSTIILIFDSSNEKVSA